MTPEQELGDIIEIVIALNSLNDNFDTITTSLLESRDKTIDQIQSILQLREVKNISKHVTEVTKDLAIAFRDNNGLKKSIQR